MSEQVQVRCHTRMIQVLVSATVALASVVLASVVLVVQSPAGAAVAESGVAGRKQISRCDRWVASPFTGDSGDNGSMIAVEAKIRCTGDAFLIDAPNDKIILSFFRDDNSGSPVYLGRDEVDLSDYWYRVRATAQARKYCRRTGSFEHYFGVAYFKYHWRSDGEIHGFEGTLRGQGRAIMC